MYNYIKKSGLFEVSREFIVDVLEIRDLWFKYPVGDWVLRGVDLSVKRGEHVLIIGDTGSGKTTLVRAITNIGRLIYNGEVKGSIRVLGRDLLEYTRSELFRVIGVVGQNPYLYFTDLHVYRDLYNYAVRIYRDPLKAERALRKIVETMSLHNLLERYFFELSGGEAKRVIVAKALIADPQILLLDEPLMWLDEYGVKDVLEVLRTLRRLGKSVVVFEHRFIPLIDYFDRILILKHGRLHEATSNVRKLLTTQRTMLLENPFIKNKHEEGEIVLKAIGIHHYYNSKRILRDINITVRDNDKILIYGVNGSGKTTLLKILAGYLKPSKGLVERRGDVIYIPQNIILFYTEETVKREIEEICKSRHMGVNCVEEGLKKVKLLNIDLDISPFNLSHGQMVKLAIVLATISNATIILIDEPFSGLTYSDRLKLIKELLILNNAVVLASSWIELATIPNWSRVLKLENNVLMPLDSIKSTYTLEELAEAYGKLTGEIIA